MPSYRLRVEVRDVPGALAHLTTALARRDVDVLRVDVQGVDGRVAIDELHVLTPEAVREGALRRLVADAGATMLHLAPLAEERGTDPVASALRLAGQVAAAADPLHAADGALADLLDAPAWVLPAPHEGEPLLGHEALTSPTVTTLSTPGGIERDALATLAMVPHAGLLAVALRWGRWTFTASELARATALVDLTARRRPARTVPPPLATLIPLGAGGDVAVRPIVPADAAHLLDLDLRLTDRTRRLRFLSARGLPTGPELRSASAPPSRDGIAVGAWTARGLAGVGRIVRLDDEPGTAEFALVVSDADQRRGIGGVLLQRLVVEARRRGLRRLVAHVAADNRGIRRLVQREAPMSILRIAHGQAELVVDLRTTPSVA